MLAWWGERLDAANHGRVEEGAYYDQRWLDLVPALFGGVEVLRDERFNVGHWSLPERDAADVRLLHASGFDPERPRTVTSHDPRLADVEARARGRAARALRGRAARGRAAREAARLPWGWTRFADGAPVPWMAGDVLSALGPDGDAFRSRPARAAGRGRSRRGWRPPPTTGRPAITRLWIGDPRLCAATCAKRSRTRWARTVTRSPPGSRATARASTASRRPRGAGGGAHRR